MNKANSRQRGGRGEDSLVPVYIARYILFLIIYIVIMAVSVFAVRAFLYASDGGAYTALAAEPLLSLTSNELDAMAEVDEEEYVQAVINGVTFTLDRSRRRPSPSPPPPRRSAEVRVSKSDIRGNISAHIRTKNGRRTA